MKLRLFIWSISNALSIPIQFTLAMALTSCSGIPHPLHYHHTHIACFLVTERLIFSFSLSLSLSLSILDLIKGRRTDNICGTMHDAERERERKIMDPKKERNRTDVCVLILLFLSIHQYAFSGPSATLLKHTNQTNTHTYTYTQVGTSRY